MRELLLSGKVADLRPCSHPRRIWRERRLVVDRCLAALFLFLLFFFFCCFFFFFLFFVASTYTEVEGGQTVLGSVCMRSHPLEPAPSSGKLHRQAGRRILAAKAAEAEGRGSVTRRVERRGVASEKRCAG